MAVPIRVMVEVDGVQYEENQARDMVQNLLEQNGVNFVEVKLVKPTLTKKAAGRKQPLRKKTGRAKQSGRRKKGT